MKKNKTIAIIISTVSILLILVSILTYHFVQNMREDKKQTLAIMEQIKEKYNEFSKMVESFTHKRADFYEMKENAMYLESMQENRADIEKFMSEYELVVLEIHNKNTYLQDNCQRRYSDHRVNNTCELFKQGYEAVMNYYITDLKVYNTIIESYNAWVTENGEEGFLNKITFSLYNDYIDYDNDGSYLGGK